MQETQETRVRFLGWEDLLEKEMATLSSILVWKITWTEEPGEHGVAELDTTEHTHTHHIHLRVDQLLNQTFHNYLNVPQILFFASIIKTLLG